MLRTFSKNYQRGFTIIEMITVIAIVVIMTGVVLANLPDFRERTSLELVAQEIALVIRQAQAFGANTRGANTTTFQFPSYGVYFNLSAVTIAFQSSTAFRLFADANNPDGILSDSSGMTCATPLSECREVYNLQGGLSITKLEICPSSGTCTDLSGPVHPLNIVFTRPNPEAKFLGETAGTDLCATGCSYAKITLTSARNLATRCIYVWTTGHIYTKPCS